MQTKPLLTAFSFAAAAVSMAIAQSASLVRVDDPVTHGADASTFLRNVTHFTYDLRASTGGSDWTGSEIEVDVVGTGRIWHATDQRIAENSPPNDPNEICYLHNLQVPGITFNVQNNGNSRMHDTFFTAPGIRFLVDPSFASPGVSSPDPAACPAQPPITSTATRLRGRNPNGVEIPLAWFDAVTAPLNNTVLARFTFQVPPQTPLVGLEPTADSQLFATIRVRVTSSTNIPGNLFVFDLYQYADCNTNGVSDATDISSGTSEDCNLNGIPDECEVQLSPVITQHPTPISNCGASDATFTVATEAAGVSYRWRRNGVDLVDGPSAGGGTISGSDTATLTITAAGVADSGEYSARVTNGCGSANSLDAILSIFDPLPLLFVTNSANTTGNGGNVAAVNASSGARLETVGAPGEITFPNGIAIDPDGNLYVVNSAAQQVEKRDWRTGNILNSFDAGPNVGMIDPVGAAVYVNGSERWLYVTGYTSNNVVRFNLDDPSQSSVFFNLGALGIVTPGAIVARPGGNLLIAAEESDLVIEVSSTGAFLRIAAAGCGLDLPSGITVQSGGTLLISSLRTNSVIQFSASGACLGTLVSSGSGGLSQPYGLRETAGGEILVASRLTNQILRYRASTGAFLGVFADGLDRPRYFVTNAVCEPDCNTNGRPDFWDISNGSSTDCNLNGYPDDCELELTPRIDAQPTSIEVCAGNTATITAGASGDPTLAYRWQRNGQPLSDGATASGSMISGATTPTLEISNTSASDEADYRLVVTNLCGAATSDSAALTVRAALTITQQPQGALRCEGTSFTLSVVANGAEPIQYQWTLDGNPIAGANSPSYEIGSVNAATVGPYAVQITNFCGTITSEPAVLAFTSQPDILTGPASQTVCAGNAVVFSVVPDGPLAAFTYEWRRDDNPLSGGDSQVLLLSRVTPADAGTYTVTITETSTGCTRTSEPATLTVTRLPGDVTYDGEVDLVDLASLLTNFGITSGMDWEDGDLDGNGAVDLVDLATLLSVFGIEC